MAITNYASYVAKCNAPNQRMQDTKVNLTTQVGRMLSFWTVAPDAGAAPTTAAVPTRTTAGAIGQENGGSTALRLIQAPVSVGQSGCLIICDRLSHQGGLSGTVTTAQTTNLPTAALTRYTSGVGVFAALEIYTLIGTTATTVTASYTNQDGTAGRTAPLSVIGGTSFREASRFLILPLQQGDSGVRSVENVTVTATTGTAGNFGVTLFKPLFAMPMVNLGSQQFLFDPLITNCGNFPEIVDDACLFYTFIANTASSGVMCNALRFAVDDT